MKNNLSGFIFVIIILAQSAIVSAKTPSVVSGSQKYTDFVEVQKLLGAIGHVQGDVYIIFFPRKDLSVTVNGYPIPVAFGLVCWTAWRETPKGMMLMGDLALLESEVNPVISTLSEAGIEISSIHNHFFHDNPPIKFIHIYGLGNPYVLALGLRTAMDKTGGFSYIDYDSISHKVTNFGINTRKIEEITGLKGILADGVFRINMNREGVRMDGMDIPSAMGINSWAAFIGSNDNAIVAGNIVMSANEVNKVIYALKSGGIDVVAVHNHMLNEEPRVFYLHYWGSGSAEKLAKTVKQAFEEAKGPIR